MRLWIISFCALGSSVLPASEIDAAQLVRRAFLNDADIFEAARNYTYERHRVVTEFDKKGEAKVTKDETDEVMILYGRPYEKRLKKDGQDLSASDAEREEKNLNKEAEKRRKNAGKHAEREEKEAADRRRALTELGTAFHFTIVGKESPGGRDTWVIEAIPNADFQPQSRTARIYPKLSGKLWIDVADERLVKLEAHVNDTIAFGWFLLVLKPGAIFEHERVRQSDGVWLAKRDLAKGKAKIAGLKTIDAEVATSYGNYRKFEAESKIAASVP